MPPLVIGAAFGLILTNPYELAHKAMENEGRPWPPPDEMKLDHLVEIGILYVPSQIYRMRTANFYNIQKRWHNKMGF